MKQTLGWIGLGTMGLPMANRLVRAGYRVVACGSGRRDLSDVVKGTGIELAASPKEIAEQTNIMISMIPNGEALLDVICGENGIGKTDLAGKILVDMSTVDPKSSAAAAGEMEKRGGSLLRATVTGSVHFAKAGTLGIMISGRRSDYEECLPYLEKMGNRQTYLGEKEEARYMKVLINMLLADVLQSYSETLVLGEKLGMDWNTMIDLIADSAAAAPIVQYKAESMKQRDFKPTSTGYNMHKDMKMAMELVQDMDAHTPMSAAAMQMYNSLISMNMGDLDSSALVLINERMNNIETQNRR